MEFLELLGALVVVGIVCVIGYFIISLIGSIIAIVIYVAIGIGVIALVFAFIGELFISVPLITQTAQTLFPLIC